MNAVPAAQVDFLHALAGIGMIAATAIVQMAAQRILTMLLATKALAGHRRARSAHGLHPASILVAVVVLMIGHLLQVVVWALLYFHWGELGSFATSLYFSLASFTTVGANELALSPPHRMAGALEAATGVLMFGWSTALLVRVVQHSEPD